MLNRKMYDFLYAFLKQKNAPDRSRGHLKGGEEYEQPI